MKRLHTTRFLLIIMVFLISSGSLFFLEAMMHPPLTAPFQKESAEPRIKVSISGIWESNIGWRYDIKQKGSSFTWTVINRNQTAVGTIAKNNKDIQVTWNDNGSKGTAKGSIIDADGQGKATFIEWDNGVFFHRK